MNIHLANHITIEPMRIIEDLLLEMGMLSYHLDFVAKDTKEEEDIIILGRPFIAQVRTKNDVSKENNGMVP